MKTLLTGATGSIGHRLVRALGDVVVLSRNPAAAKVKLGVDAYAWDPMAGPPPAAEAGWIEGRAGERRDGAEVVFHVRFAADGTVSDVRFEAFGCPHTLATAAWVAGQLRGRESGALVPGTPLEWAEALQVPAPRLGRLLTIEDALRAVAIQRRTGGMRDARDAT